MSQTELLISPQNDISSGGLHLREGADQEPQSHPQRFPKGGETQWKVRGLTLPVPKASAVTSPTVTDMSGVLLPCVPLWASV